MNISASFIDLAASSILDGNEAFTKIRMDKAGKMWFGNPNHEGFVLAKAPTRANPSTIKAVVFVPDASALRFVVVLSSVHGIDPVTGCANPSITAEHFNAL